MARSCPLQDAGPWAVSHTVLHRWCWGQIQQTRNQEGKH